MTILSFSTKLDGAGGGQVQFSPPSGAVDVASVAVSVSTSTKQPTADLYRNGTTQACRVDGTYTGAKDTVRGLGMYQPGETLIVVWAGGDPGATATATITFYPSDGSPGPPASLVPFSNSVVGGNTLVRSAIQSPGFLTGGPGWSIDANGTITLIFGDGSQLQLYAGSYTEQAGGVLNGTWESFTPAPQAGAVWAAGVIGAQSSPAGPMASLLLASPYDTSHADPQSIIELRDQGVVSIAASLVQLVAGGSGGTGGGQFFVLGPTATSVILSAHVNGDLRDRFTLDASGRMSWGSGLPVPDTTMYRAAARVLVADPIKANVGGVAETWQALTPLNLFTNRGAGFPALSCRKVASPYGDVELVGQLVSGATVASGTQIGAVPAGYAPATEMVIRADNGSALGNPVFVSVQTSGAVLLFGTWAAGNVIQIGPDTYPTDL